MATLPEVIVRQRRFQRLFVGLLVLALFLGLVIVPIEASAPNQLITNEFDGIWWAVTTITSVGYGDMVPVTMMGRVLGMVLQIAGVLAFGLLVSMVTVALDDAKERYYRQRLEERLDSIERMLQRTEKREDFMVRNQVDQDKA